ncbi:sucrose-6-phosphate hydrolase [Liquorilactobacillus satsumensis]|uniref:sucrose-6-phosphate hydrolase n=1 Tax=Liquorilactobacillus satsumensis TaxID=259059 RepID=UPI0021C4BC31|nr:sucrose-6-phosphate hydrolase [Liquorilactobacillus satsumensis]MCP9328594.1 sucrose-6-phosphate hydrolase [Liquorilactobacillus satsumensis]
MEWTRSKRYLPYNKWDAEYLLKLQAQTAASAYRPSYHIAPTSGLLNDPNGFSFFNGQWHLFYQSFPFGPVHGLKSWVHLVSTDLVHWQNLGTALKPSTQFDSHGVYSGSASVIGDKLFLMYTGNVRDSDWIRSPYQNGAWLNQNNQLTKLEKPLITQPQHTTDHFRDPQLLQKDDKYYALIGAQDAATQSGQIAVFSSTNLHDWKDLGYLNFAQKSLGYMIECPNLVFVAQQPVLIFCPQGLDPEIAAYQNIYPNMYLIGSNCNLEKGEFTPAATLSQLDYGFDVYASQAFTAPDGQSYLISWLGLPEIEYPTDSENWAHCLTQVKQLSLENGQLYQQPVPAIRALRQQPQPLTGRTAASETILTSAPGKHYELELTFSADQTGTLYLFRDIQKKHGLKIDFSSGENASLTVDRSQAGLAFAQKYGTTRRVPLEAHQKLVLDVFVDYSVCEIFINNGQRVLSMRVFPTKDETAITLAGQAQITYNGSWWNLTKTNS